MTTKTILITGAASGIGLALAKQFQALGHQVIVTARKPVDITKLSELGFTTWLLDVTNSQHLAEVALKVEQQFGGLDMLINNAGYGAMGPALDATTDQWQQQFATNVVALAQVSQALLPALRKKQGVIANVGSVSAKFVTPFAGLYCASKAAVHALNDAMRMELAPLGVKVVLIQPGAIATGFADAASAGLSHWLATNSPWQQFAAGIAARARASADNPTPVAEFAKQVTRQLLQNKPPYLIVAGNGSSSLVWLKGLLPTRWLDWVLQRRFGLR